MTTVTVTDAMTPAARTTVVEKAARPALARPLILGAIFGVVLCLPIFTVG
jgi:hypothetical protein